MIHPPSFLLALTLPWAAIGAEPSSSNGSETVLGNFNPEIFPEPLPLKERKPKEAWNTPEGQALRNVWEANHYQFTPAVKGAYLTFAKAEARRALQASGREIPANFLAWVDSDPVIAATVYGARHNPAEVLTVLRSLEIDLGTEEIRNKHTQLALAMAMVHSQGDDPAESGGVVKKSASKSDKSNSRLGISLASRPKFQLRVPGNPLKPVNTHPTDRPLDQFDLIVNFFEGRTVEIDGKPAKKGDPPVKKTVPMAACDVIADPKLQADFNAYMKAHGQNVEIHCGDHVVFRNSRAAVRGPEAKGILEAYRLFKSAYEAKGLLPAKRDPSPTLAETFAWLSRNDETPMPEGIKRPSDQWPIFPLNAPWPVLTYLAQNRQPLREVEDIFLRYRDKGEFHGYGEYIGGIAQQGEFQAARRLAPYPFGYGTFQMMLKDGGVCGTMANIKSRSELALGIPSTTAGQPGHCALVSMRYSDSDKTYSLVGSQFVTGGPTKTTPHLSWVFSEDIGRRPMIYPMSTTYAVNYSVQSFLDSNMAWKLHRLLLEADRKAHGLALLQSAISLNPYNLLVVEEAVDTAANSQDLTFLAQGFLKLVSATNKPGCPKSGLYSDTVLDKVCKRLAEMPVPSDRAQLAKLADLTEKAKDAPAWAKFQVALIGDGAIQKKLLEQLNAGVVGQRDPEATELLSKRIQSVIDSSPKSQEKTSWITTMLTSITGHETYQVGKKRKVYTDPCSAVILKAAGKHAEAAAREAAKNKALSQDASQDLSDRPENKTIQ